MTDADTYARSVVAGDVPAGTYHRLACQRHLDDRRRRSFVYRFDADKAEKACAFIELLKHYKGEWAGQPIRLEGWQRFVVGSVFGWVHRETGYRRYRIAYNELPRKNGKSLLAAGVILYATFADGEAGAEGYVAATKRDQARIVFDDAKRLVQSSGLKDRITVQVRNLHVPTTASKLEPLSADHDTMDGLNVHACVLDEYHAMKDRGMVDVIETAMGARRQPLLFPITTAGDDPLSPCGDMHDYACKVLDGTITDETLFAFIAHADDGDDPFEASTWQKANPNYGVSVKPEDLEALARKAANMPSALATFRQKRLNIWIASGQPWLDTTRWQAGQSDRVADFVEDGATGYLGLDLSSKMDLASVTAAFPPETDGARWRWISMSFTPEENLKARAKSFRAPLEQWVADGYVTLCPGNRIDQRLIFAQIARWCEQFTIRRLGFDPWNIGNLATDLLPLFDDDDDRVIEVPQNMGQLSEPSKEVEALIAESQIDANGDPLLAWAVSNAVVDIDANGNLKPTKNPKKLRGRIDPLLAGVLAVKVARVDLDDGDDPVFYEINLGGDDATWA